MIYTEINGKGAKNAKIGFLINKNSKIRIIVEDQFPLSEKKTIEVERLDFSKAKLDTKTGKLIWELDLEPNEKQVVSYKYSVKYPNYLRLNLE